MACKGKWLERAKELEGLTKLAPESVAAAARCIKCSRPLLKDGSCVMGHAQNARQPGDAPHPEELQAVMCAYEELVFATTDRWEDDPRVQAADEYIASVDKLPLEDSYPQGVAVMRGLLAVLAEADEGGTWREDPRLRAAHAFLQYNLAEDIAAGLAEMNVRIEKGRVRDAKSADEAAAEIAQSFGYDLDSPEYVDLQAALCDVAGESFPGEWEDYNDRGLIADQLRALLHEFTAFHDAAAEGTLAGGDFRSASDAAEESQTLLADEKVAGSPLGRTLAAQVGYYQGFVEGSLADSDWPRWDEAAEESRPAGDGAAEAANLAGRPIRLNEAEFAWLQEALDELGITEAVLQLHPELRGWQWSITGSMISVRGREAAPAAPWTVPERAEEAAPVLRSLLKEVLGEDYQVVPGAGPNALIMASGRSPDQFTAADKRRLHFATGLPRWVLGRYALGQEDWPGVIRHLQRIQGSRQLLQDPRVVALMAQAGRVVLYAPPDAPNDLVHIAFQFEGRKKYTTDTNLRVFRLGLDGQITAEVRSYPSWGAAAWAIGALQHQARETQTLHCFSCGHAFLEISTCPRCGASATRWQHKPRSAWRLI